MGKLSSFVAGGLIGAGAALLFARRTGEETRAIISEKIEGCLGADAAEKVEEFVEVIDDGAEDVVDTIQDKIEEARARIAEQIAKNAEAVKEVVSEIGGDEAEAEAAE